MRLSVCFFLSLFLGICSTYSQNNILFSEKELTLVKNKIKNNDPQYVEAYKQLIKHADSLRKIGYFPRVTNKKITPVSDDIHDYVSMATYYWPNPYTDNGLPYVAKDGMANPDVAKINNYSNLVQISKRTQILGLAYFFSEDEKYVLSALPFLRLFFLKDDTRMNPNMNHAQFIMGQNTGRIEGSIEGRFFVDLVCGVQLLKKSSNFKSGDYLALQEWFKEFLNWMDTSDMGRKYSGLKNNIETAYHMQRLAYATFINDTSRVTNIYESDLPRLIKQQFSINGLQYLELKRAKPDNYSIANLYYWTKIDAILKNNNKSILNLTIDANKILLNGINYIKRFDKPSLDNTHRRMYDFIMSYNNYNLGGLISHVKETTNLSIEESIDLLTFP